MRLRSALCALAWASLSLAGACGSDGGAPSGGGDVAGPGPGSPTAATGGTGSPVAGTDSSATGSPTGGATPGGTTGGTSAGTPSTGGGGATSGGADGDGTGGSAGTPAGASVIRFVALGDTGDGSDTQKAVASAIASVCADKGCDFVQLLGDNIYETGVDSTTDPQWQTKFEEPYAGVDLPFWAVLGNHDNGGLGAGTEPLRGDFQVQYTQVSDKWKMPARHYSHVEGPAEFFALDTNAGMLNTHQQQTTEVAAMLQASTSSWKVAFGHHPYLSNGPHGNAGNYEGLGFLPGINGAGVKELLEGSVCGTADVYICGHDHSKQWLEGTCNGTELIVSGAGASVTALPGSNPTRFQDIVPGFLWVEISSDTFLAEFYDQTGAMQFSRTLTK